MRPGHSVLSSDHLPTHSPCVSRADHHPAVQSCRHEATALLLHSRESDHPHSTHSVMVKCTYSPDFVGGHICPPRRTQTCSAPPSKQSCPPQVTGDPRTSAPDPPSRPNTAPGRETVFKGAARTRGEPKARRPATRATHSTPSVQAPPQTGRAQPDSAALHTHPEPPMARELAGSFSVNAAHSHDVALAPELPAACVHVASHGWC